MRSIPYRVKLTLLTLYCLAVLLFCLHYSSSITAAVDKQSPPLSLHGNFCVLGNAFNGFNGSNETGRKDAVTLVLHISADYIHEKTLFDQVSNWNGPVSIAVYFEQPESETPCIDELLASLWSKHPETMKHLSVHYYTKVEQCDGLVHHNGKCERMKHNKSVREIADYPANTGRNIAREFVNTNYILIGDYEHLFSHGFERRMAEMAVREKISETETVLVYRIFEIDPSVKSPKNKKDLSLLLKKKKAVVFHERFYKRGHTIPGLEDWLKTGERLGDGISERNLSMQSRFAWEPQFVSSSFIPFHDEAFPYMIRDNTCLRWEMCRAGYILHLVDDLFMFHRGIKTAKDVLKTKQIQSTNKKRFYAALGDFKKRMDVLYPSTKDSCPVFRA